MRRFRDVVGHRQIIEHFQNAIKMDKVSHAYIISGEEGSGKQMLAEIFAALLQCEGKGTEPCLECRSCKQADSRNHPDIIWVTHEKPGSIGAEDVRDQVVGNMQIKPYNGKYKIYIIDEAEKLTPQAQNALLKTIEEPPLYGIVMLLTVNREVFLPTILSRCVTLDLKPVENRIIKKYLMEDYQIPDYKAEVCVAFAQGNLGKAMKLARLESFEEMKNHVTKTMQQMAGMDLSRLLDILRELEDYKIDIMDYLDLMLVWFRDVLLFKVTRDANGLIFKEEFSAISRQAATSSYEGLEEIITAIEKVKVRLNANVNFELTIELMLFTIKENLE